MPTPYVRSSRLRHRAGISLAEVLAALVVVSVGLLGIAGSSALSLRRSAGALRERSAIGRLERRFALLDAAGCTKLGRDSMVDRVGVTERWTLEPPIRGVALAEASVEWRDAGRPRVTVLRSAILC